MFRYNLLARRLLTETEKGLVGSGTKRFKRTSSSSKVVRLGSVKELIFSDSRDLFPSASCRRGNKELYMLKTRSTALFDNIDDISNNHQQQINEDALSTAKPRSMSHETEVLDSPRSFHTNAENTMLPSKNQGGGRMPMPSNRRGRGDCFLEKHTCRHQGRKFGNRSVQEAAEFIRRPSSL